MDATVIPHGMALAITDEELQNEDQERLAYDKRVNALRKEEYPMLKGMSRIPPTSLETFLAPCEP